MSNDSNQAMNGTSTFGVARFVKAVKVVGVAAAVAAGTLGMAVASPRASHAAEAKGGLTVAAGSHIDGKNFKLDVTAADCKAGSECTATIRLEALGEFHINDNYPYKFKASDVAGVEFLGKDAAGKAVFSKAAGDFKKDAEKVATLTVRFKPAAKGNVTIGGQYKMSVCSAQNCQLETQDVSLAVAAK